MKKTERLILWIILLGFLILISGVITMGACNSKNFFSESYLLKKEGLIIKRPNNKERYTQ